MLVSPRDLGRFWILSFGEVAGGRELVVFVDLVSESVLSERLPPPSSRESQVRFILRRSDSRATSPKGGAWLIPSVRRPEEFKEAGLGH